MISAIAIIIMNTNVNQSTMFDVLWGVLIIDSFNLYIYRGYRRDEVLTEDTGYEIPFRVFFYH